MRQSVTSQRDIDQDRFQLEVTDANGEQLSSEACPHCARNHHFVVKSMKVPTIGFTNPLEEEVTARVLLNDEEIQSVILRPGETHRIFGDQVDLKNPPDIWGGKVEVIFRRIVDPTEVEYAEAELHSALINYAQSVKFEKPEILAEIVQNASKQVVDHCHNGLLDFNFLNQETWEKVNEASAEFDYLVTVLVGGDLDIGALIKDPRFDSPNGKTTFEA